LEVTTAIELSDEEAQKIVGEIEQAAGRKVEATRLVDPSLIGGLVVQAGSVRLDASVRGRLNQLREELTT
jgi:F-type H+-transporting ATPase subunit delta